MLTASTRGARVKWPPDGLCLCLPAIQISREPQALFAQCCLYLTTQYPSLHTQPKSSARFPRLHALPQHVGQAQEYLPLFLQQRLQCELGPVDSALSEGRKEGFSQPERNKGSHESDGHFEAGRWHHFKTQGRMENSILKYIFCALPTAVKKQNASFCT